jgi:hypothetical protein
MEQRAAMETDSLLEEVSLCLQVGWPRTPFKGLAAHTWTEGVCAGMDGGSLCGYG